jgi:hypothetical protein
MRRAFGFADLTMDILVDTANKLLGMSNGNRNSNAAAPAAAAAAAAAAEQIEENVAVRTAQRRGDFDMDVGVSQRDFNARFKIKGYC